VKNVDPRTWGMRLTSDGKMPASLGQASSKRHLPLWWAPVCKVEQRLQVEFEVIPR